MVALSRKTDKLMLMSASGIAVNQLAHIQMRSLASNATMRREAILESSVLYRQGALFLRSQPIGGTDLFGGRCAEALRVASEQKKNSLLFQATMGSSRKLGSVPMLDHHEFLRVHDATSGREDIPPPSLRLCRPFILGASSRRARSLVSPNLRFDRPTLPSLLPVGARLLNFASEWNLLTTDSYVRAVVRGGYRIELSSQPPLYVVPIPMRLSPASGKSLFLKQEITSLLDK